MTKPSFTQRTNDPFYPSSLFAKVPAEALGFLGHGGDTGMSHAEFRIFVALCRFRGAKGIVNPTRETLERMTGMTPNNVSRATKALQDKGWLRIHYADQKKRKVVNYELLIAQAKRISKESGELKSQATPVPSNLRETPDTQAEQYENYDEPEVNSLSEDELAILMLELDEC